MPNKDHRPFMARNKMSPVRHFLDGDLNEISSF
jgi:hypothetical protein